MSMFDKLNIINEFLNYRYQRAKVITSNIANADTPGYKPKELLFEKYLKQEIPPLPLKRTNPKHMDPYYPPPKFKQITIENPPGYDKNKVNLDEELAKLTDNNLAYQVLTQMMIKEIEKMKRVIKGR